jgi:DNA repair exonuclease SbcCD ATPase subunit
VQEKDKEVNKYLTEIQMLATKNTSLVVEVDQLSNELSSATHAMDRYFLFQLKCIHVSMASEIEAAQRAVEEHDVIVQKLEQEKTALETQLTSLISNFDRQGTLPSCRFDCCAEEAEKDLLATLQDQVVEWKVGFVA